MSELVTVETKAILFDMDGVLIDSIGSVVRCWRRWAKLYDVPAAESFDLPHGTRAIDVVRSLRPDIDAEEGLRAIEDMEIADTADIVVLPGVRELLASLPADRWAIVTSCTQRLLLARLKAAGLPVTEKIISADMVAQGKPHPEPYLRGAELLGLTAAECVVIEDAPNGVAAGIAAGARVLAVLGTHRARELQQATWITQSLEGLRVGVNGGGLRLRFEAIAAEQRG